jgi:hypothetical protein
MDLPRPALKDIPIEDRIDRWSRLTLVLLLLATLGSVLA